MTVKYDAATLGNHDFDMGIENILKQMPHASFPFINCNYNFSDTELNGKILPFKIFSKSGLKIGVFGIGVELEGLVPKHLYGNVKYNHPVHCANSTAHHLKHNMNCDYIVCLSHLGYKYDSKKISDVTLVPQSKNIDLVIGGHTHTFLNEPVSNTNLDGKQTLITQVGWAHQKLLKQIGNVLVLVFIHCLINLLKTRILVLVMEVVLRLLL